MPKKKKAKSPLKKRNKSKSSISNSSLNISSDASNIKESSVVSVVSESSSDKDKIF